MTILEKIKFEEDWLSEVNLTKENVKIAFAGIRATALEQTRWIPVSERLPKDGQNVLFCDIDENIMIGYHIDGRPDTHFSEQGSYDRIKNVRAWMPLVQPYKAESEEVNDAK